MNFERSTDGTAGRTWPNIPVRWAMEKRASLSEGRSRSNGFQVTHPYTISAQCPDMLEQCSLV